ncbi:SDR family oxidoreductase [uncultured Sphingomonas sp.]|uniref:SDR family oxidoreductase n=1 Tax=uncultured Sphingomonas sp. TaxID=158754 RepID=UPI0035CABBAD
MTDLSEQVAVVTGSSRGLGRAIALRYAALGAKVVVNYASGKTAADDTVRAIEAGGGTAIAVHGDMSQLSDIERLFTTAVAQFGKVDIAVANAGIEVIDQAIADATEEQFDRLFALNTKGAFFTLQAAARHVVDGGRIIFIGSSTTAFALPGLGLYGSSKMAPRYIVEVLAKEIGHRGVTVNSIIPTATQDAGVFSAGDNAEGFAFIEEMRPIKNGATVDAVADAAEYLAGPLSSFVSGQHLLLSGGLHI